MTRREIRESVRRRIDRGRDGEGLLRAGVTFAVAFLAGLLLVKLSERRDDDRSGNERRTVREAASRIRNRAIPAGLDPGQTAGADQSEFVNPTVRIASGGKAQPNSGRTSESPSGQESESTSERGSQSISGRETEFESTFESESTSGSESDDSESGSDGTETRTDGAASRTGGTESRTDATEGLDPEVEPSTLTPPTANGMPMLGVGTYRDADYDECLDSVRQALGTGYRHVDAIERRGAYYVEEAVGDAISQAAIDREELFVATKVDPDDLDHDHVLTSAEESLDRLDLDSLDLLYVHWPTGDYDPTETLDAFAELRQEGLVEEIGVSNFTVEQLEEAIEVCDEPIFANQVEMHPLFPQEDLREFCAQDDVDVELVAYSPLARTDVENVTELREVADEHGATPEQVSLAWLRRKGVTAIPEATTEEHLRENWLSLGLELDDEDVEKIDSIEERERVVDPDDAPWNQ